MTSDRTTATELLDEVADNPGSDESQTLALAAIATALLDVAQAIRDHDRRDLGLSAPQPDLPRPADLIDARSRLCAETPDVGGWTPCRRPRGHDGTHRGRDGNGWAQL